MDGLEDTLAGAPMPDAALPAGQDVPVFLPSLWSGNIAGMNGPPLRVRISSEDRGSPAQARCQPLRAA